MSMIRSVSARVVALPPSVESEEAISRLVGCILYSSWKAIFSSQRYMKTYLGLGLGLVCLILRSMCYVLLLLVLASRLLGST